MESCRSHLSFDVRLSYPLEVVKSKELLIWKAMKTPFSLVSIVQACDGPITGHYQKSYMIPDQLLASIPMFRSSEVYDLSFNSLKFKEDSSASIEVHEMELLTSL